MLELSKKQKSLLFEFVADGKRRNRQLNTDLQQTLGYIMSRINVRKTELIEDEFLRVLVESTFQLVKNEHLLDNGLITLARYEETVRDTQVRVLQYGPGVPDLPQQTESLNA